MAHEVYMNTGSTYETVPFETAMNRAAPVNDLALQMMLNKVPGFALARRFAVSEHINATPADVWAAPGNKVLPATAASISVVSTSAADTATGTGCQSVELVGLDASFNQINETLPLKGTTAATSVNKYLRLIRFTISAVGSTQTNAGNLSASIGGNLQSLMSAGAGIGYQSHYTVPAGKTLYLKNVFCNVGKGIEARVSVWLKPFGKGVRQSAQLDVWQDLEQLPLDYSLTVPEKSEIWLRAQTFALSGSINAVRVAAGYVYVLVDNEPAPV